MGKDIHKSIIRFLFDKLDNHQAVEDYEDLSNNDHYIFRIHRTNNRQTVTLFLTDCYHYSEFDYLSKPSILDEGGFILIAKPESDFPKDTQDNMIQDKIIIGKIGILMGALHKEEFWCYEKPSDEQKTYIK